VVTTEIPQTRWAVAPDGTYLAYQVFGGGPVDVLYVPGFASHLEVYWEYPAAARFFRRLGSIARVIFFDKRGTGLSDRVSAFADLDTMMDDVRTVLDAAGSQRTVLWGDGPDGGGACAVFAASHPDRARALVWWEARARVLFAPEYPWGLEGTAYDGYLSDEELVAVWGTLDGADQMLRYVGCSSLVGEPAAQRWIAKFYRYSATPGWAVAFSHMYDTIDVRTALSSLQVPTLVVKRVAAEREEGEHLAARIPGARLALLSEFEDFPPFLGDQDETFRVVGSFLDSVSDEESELDRVLATVLFSDIVDSTATAAVMGDTRWRTLIEHHDQLARGLVARYRGTFVRGTGDGMLATFDGPARAVHCAQAMVETARALGVEVRAGAHTGEITFGGNDLAGIGVHVAARVAAMAGPGEVWASSTVKDLTAGSGLAFEDRGEHELKGVPDRWHLYRVVA
jgi:class 3 adenylate cyclase/pimeloyl-ACP methyl ester carboxylesterase